MWIAAYGPAARYWSGRGRHTAHFTPLTGIRIPATMSIERKDQLKPGIFFNVRRVRFTGLLVEMAAVEKVPETSAHRLIRKMLGCVTRLEHGSLFDLSDQESATDSDGNDGIRNAPGGFVRSEVGAVMVAYRLP